MTVRTEPKKILIVDNEPAVLLMLSYAMRSIGAEVITASTLEPAEEALSRYHFDLVIVDIRMSGVLGIEGLELLSYIKRKWPQTEVIVMTAYGSEAVEKDAYQRGAAYYFNKPFDLEGLLGRIRSTGFSSERRLTRADRAGSPQGRKALRQEQEGAHTAEKSSRHR